MAGTYLVLSFACILTVSDITGYSVCPAKCECEENQAISDMRGTTVIDVDCKNKGFSGLPELDLLENVTIHRLYLDGNRITSIPDNMFNGFRIIGIELTDNPLSHISHDAFKGLEYYLEYLSMQRISLNHPLHSFLDGLTMLRTLDLTGVATPVMTSLSNGTFGTLRMLETLVLKQCGISFIDKKAFIGVESIMDLRLDSNKLSSIPLESFRPLMELRSLNLDQNQISEIPNDSFRNLMNLQKLSISDNKISDHRKIEAAAFRGIGHNLMELDLSFNQLKELPTHSFENLFNLGSLKVSDNQITKLKNGTFERLTHLMTLDLSGNAAKVTYAVLRGMEMSLVNLLLARTGMTSDTIPVDALKRFRYLRDLDLSGNQLGILTNASFSGITARKIRMSHCGITSAESDTFLQLQPPLDVELNYNNIEKLNFVTDPCLFRELELNRNPRLDCDCDFLKIVRHQTTKFVGQCASPAVVGGKDFTVASRNPDIIELCKWENQTDKALCDWMSSGTCGIHTRFLIGALCMMVSTFGYHW